MSWKGDPNAIHTVVDGEIDGLTEKASPVSADLVVIEDSANGNAKAKAQAGSLAGALDHGNLAGRTDDDHSIYVPTDGSRQFTKVDVSGLTGATEASRYVGATTSGAPASGTFAVGDYVVAQDGSIFVCTTAGSPGTWTSVAGAGSLPSGTTKGDLAVYDGTNWVRIGAGADDTVLTADSAQTEGIKWAAGGGGSGAVTVIDHQELASSASAITVSSISNTFRQLWWVGALRTDRASNDTDVVHLRVGNTSVDTGSNYRWRRHFEGTTSGTDSDASATSARVGGCAGATADTDAFGTFELLLPRYSDTTGHRGWNSKGHIHGGDSYIQNCTGRWVNTADEIDVVSIISGTGNNFVAGSWMTLYGLS